MSVIERLRSIPILFPLVAAFHVIMLIVTVFNFAQAGVLDTFVTLGSVTDLLLYTALWVFVAMQHRWAAVGYIVLTMINLALQFLTPHGSEWKHVSDVLLPFDVLLCFFLLFYYKRFR